jgi:hypothetical protein
MQIVHPNSLTHYLIVVTVTVLLSACGGGYTAVSDTFPTESPSARKSSPANSGKGSATKTSALIVSWIAPTLNDDGSALTDLKGYVILLGSQSGIYDRSIHISDPKAAQYSIEGLAAAQYFVSVKAVNLDGVESMASEETSRLVQ